jgi:hypothetical protein
MKKTIMFIALVLSFLATYATDIVERTVKISFQKEFPRAKYESWNKMEECGVYSVRFVQDNEVLQAYFDQAGCYLGFARAVEINKMPPKVKRSFEKVSAGTVLTYSEELVLMGETIYQFEFRGEKTTRAYLIRMDGSAELISIKRNIVK